MTWTVLIVASWGYFAVRTRLTRWLFHIKPREMRGVVSTTMHIPIIVSQLGVLSCAVGVLGLRGVPGVRVSPVTGPPASISSLGVSPSSVTPSSAASAFHTSVVSVVSPPMSGTTQLSVRSSSSSPLSTSAPATVTGSLGKRAAIPACLKTVELSCLNLAANCINSVNSGNFNNLWGIQSCVAAATCYSVGDLITSVECQTGLTVTNAAQASLDYTNIYAGIVGSCAFASGGCPITQQNFIDFYYGTLTAINTANFPSSSAVVIALWNAITAWAATGSTVPYLNFNDWLHFSSFPSTTTTTAPPVTTYTEIDWNPNPAPPSGAVSETFVTSTTTVIIVIPTTTTTVVVAGASITLAPGGTPVNGPLPSGVSIPGAVTPTWNPNIIPPTSVSSVTFTAPPSFTTVVAVPTGSNSPPQNITGPPGDKNSNGDDWWLLLFPGIIGGLLPADIGIPGGFKPTAAPPPGWTGPWTDPDPTSSSTSTKSTSASSSSSSSSCPKPTSAYALSDDSADADWQDLGTDPDRRRNILEARAGRTISLPVCGLSAANGNAIANPNTVSLGAGTYYSIGLKAAGGVGTVLNPTNVNGRPVGNGAGLVNQEHVFELGYLSQYFTSLINNGLTCTWVLNNVYNRVGLDGVTPWSISLLQDIDQTVNMVWVDKPLNQAKSNVVDQDVSTPQQANINKITDFMPGGASFNLIQDLEYFIRNFATLGTYFGNTAGTFQATALRVQNRLSQITPDTPDVNLPVAFNSWLRNLMSTYPNGCTSRANAAYQAYRTKMTAIANQVNNGVVPPCFPLYAAGIAAQTIPNWQALVPPPPNLPACNSPGTEGNIQFGINPNGTPEPSISTFRILGSDNPDFYAIGDGTDFSGDHFIADDISTQYANCQGAWDVGLSAGATGASSDAYLAVNCNGQTGNQVTALISFVINNQVLDCVSINTNVPAGTGVLIGIICAGTTAAATTCANSVLQTSYPTGNLLTGSLEFIPT
ncbi:Chitin synthase [Mycena venus]|uniref:Chitin synthase n=1 Tax=Mycena venus TaxID=2733690 RepID=A0A8H6XLY7_9AGAR|nr:Chitin synthase [Mycena venus]